MRDWHAFNQGVVEQFRANGGIAPGSWAGQPLLLLTTTGARSGLPRTTPLLYSADGDRIVVIASKGGEPTHPDWYHNLVAHPEATVEVGAETVPVRAEVAQGDERRRLFDQQAALMPFFAEYERTTPRTIPVVVLTRREVSRWPAPRSPPASAPGIVAQRRQGSAVTPATVARNLAAFLADLPSAWVVATPTERNRLMRQLHAEAIIETRTVVAVKPRPELLPFLQAVNSCAGGSDGDRSRRCVISTAIPP